MNISKQTKGTLFCVVGVLIISPDSLIVRELSHLPNYTVIFYKFIWLNIITSIHIFNILNFIFIRTD